MRHRIHETQRTTVKVTEWSAACSEIQTKRDRPLFKIPI